MEKKEVLELARKKKKGSMDEWETQVAQKGFSLVLNCGRAALERCVLHIFCEHGNPLSV